VKAGLLGYPIAHSLSPAIHTAAYEALGLDWEYKLYPCEDYAAFLRILAEAQADPVGFVGFNVTTPYKVEAYEACATHTRFSTAVGNANVITFPNSSSDSPGQPCLASDSTDGRGLVASLEREGGIAVAGSSVVLCGTGPVALSVLLSLIDAQVASVSILSRKPHEAREALRILRERLASEHSAHERNPQAVDDAGDASSASVQSPLLPKMWLAGYDAAAACLETADILIDATPIGMNADDAPVVSPEALKPGLVVLDTVYGHGETALLRAARAVGAVAVDGLGMLIEQAALTIEIWARAQGTPVEAPRALMRQTALSRH
jgi:shikimate dehydrogenase